ncbi:MAG: aminotransferase class I/II-fold pyridoxal phosphate-dependent enzyme [Lachnospiraceae bacterium]|nr:aminotransferase class I/II-fold pyridoxal phosphate-dependent enzyme [Lachnospiraceae bacterium]
MEHLYDKLTEYAGGRDYPYHMPGHKRRTFGEMPPDVYEMDVTEIDGFDDLHAPEGILKDLQERVARLYGADESFCLVGGSTAGILAALSAALPEGGHLLMARNCHKSAYHAAYLRNLKLTYLLPDVMDEFGICDGLQPGEIERALENAPDVQAVLIVSPTYEGRISPVREIAKIVHAHGKILIVDEAHGAHLGLAGRARNRRGLAGDAIGGPSGLTGDVPLQENSCQAGADLVIHSVHKTLPAMTQTALLHVNGDRVDREKLRRFLRIYQSSSPSYVLMASIDNAVTMMEQGGEKLYGDLVRNFTWLMKELSACRHFRFLGVKTPEDLEKQEGQDDHASAVRAGTRAVRQDLGKLVIHGGTSGLTGQQIYDVLRDRYHLQLEMAAGDYCLAMFTVGDTPEGYQRMRDALLEMDERAEELKKELERDRKEACREVTADETDGEPHVTLKPVVARSLKEAWDAVWEEVPLSDCEGRISAEFVNLYPPGTPIVAPGEVFTKKIVNALLKYQTQELRLRGVSGKGTVRCLTD